VTQKFYWHDATTSDTGTLPGSSTQSATSPTVTASGASTNRSMTGTIGASQVGPTLSSSASASKQNNWFRRFVSLPLAGEVVAAGTWQMRAAIKTGSSSVSAWKFSAIVYTWRPSTGAKVTTVIDAVTTGIGTAAGTSETDTGVATITASGSAVTVAPGDILVIEVWGSVTQGSATSETWTLYYDGTTEGSTTSNAAYLLAPVDIPTFGPNPAQYGPVEEIITSVLRSRQLVRSTVVQAPYQPPVAPSVPTMGTYAYSMNPAIIGDLLESEQDEWQYDLSVSAATLTAVIPPPRHPHLYTFPPPILAYLLELQQDRPTDLTVPPPFEPTAPPLPAPAHYTNGELFSILQWWLGLTVQPPFGTQVPPPSVPVLGSYFYTGLVTPPEPFFDILTVQPPFGFPTAMGSWFYTNSQFQLLQFWQRLSVDFPPAAIPPPLQPASYTSQLFQIIQWWESLYVDQNPAAAPPPLGTWSYTGVIGPPAPFFEQLGVQPPLAAVIPPVVPPMATWSYTMDPSILAFLLRRGLITASELVPVPPVVAYPLFGLEAGEERQSLSRFANTKAWFV
jgi:hypothetical protein